MIASVHGRVQAIAENEVVLEVGGVGLKIGVPLSGLPEVPKIGQPLHLFTRLIVREESLALYGFGTVEERDLFDDLLEVSGIGPRLALAALAHLSPETVLQAIASDQPETLAKVPGIGKKTAEKIVFHLKDRVAGAVAMEPISGLDTEVLAVLANLGYSLGEAQAAVQSIPPDAPADIESRVRHALKYFAAP